MKQITTKKRWIAVTALDRDYRTKTYYGTQLRKFAGVIRTTYKGGSTLTLIHFRNHGIIINKVA